MNCWLINSVHHLCESSMILDRIRTGLSHEREVKRALRGHLHQEFSPPAVVLVCHLLQTLDHLPEGGNQVEAPPWLQERTHHLEIQHWGIEHHEVESVRHKHTVEANTEHWIIYTMHMRAISSLSKTQIRPHVDSVWSSPVNCKCVWINHRRAPSMSLSMEHKWNLWIQGFKRKLCQQTVWVLLIYSPENVLCISLGWMYQICIPFGVNWNCSFGPFIDRLWVH